MNIRVDLSLLNFLLVILPMAAYAADQSSPVARVVGDSFHQSREDQTQPHSPPMKARPVKLDAVGDALPPSAISRLGTLRWVHGVEVDFAKYLSAGNDVLTVDQHGVIRIWETATGKLRRQFGKSDCKQVYWYVYHQNEKARTIPSVGNPCSKHVLAVSADEKSIAISHGDGRVSHWELSTGKLHRQFTTNVATAIAFSRDGQSLFTRGLDQLIRQYEVATGKLIRTFGKPSTDAKLLYFNDADGLIVSPDNKFVQSIYLEQREKKVQVSVRQWEIATGNELPICNDQDEMESFVAVVFSTDAKLVALCDVNGSIHVWDLVARNKVQQLKVPEFNNSGYSAAITFSPDSKQLLVRSSYRLLQCWDVNAGKMLKQIEMSKDRPTDLYVGNLAFSPDGLRIITPGSAGTVRQIELKTGHEISDTMTRHRGQVGSLALSPDGKRAVTLSLDHVLHLWNVDDGREIKQAPIKHHVERALFSADGNVLVLVGYDHKLCVRVWDAINFTEIRHWQINSDSDGRPTPGPRYVMGVDLSANGQRLAIRDYDWANQVVELRTKDDQQLKRTRYPRPIDEEQLFMAGKSLAISPDGNLLAELFSLTEGNISLRLWEVTSGKLICKFNLTQPIIKAIAFSPDGRTLAVTTGEHTIALLEVATGNERACLGRSSSGKVSAGPASVVGLTCIAFSPDGHLLAAGDSTGRIRLFDVATNQELSGLNGHVGAVVRLAFAANGKRMISGSTDTTALVWELSPRPDVANTGQPLDPKQLTELWQQVCGADAAKSYSAIHVLSKYPNQVLPLIQTRLQPVPDDQTRLNQLVADLDHNRFNIREKAQKELETLGELAESTINNAFNNKPSAEVQTRLEALRNRPKITANPLVEQTRALELLERIGTPAALQIVQRIARGNHNGRLTRDAHETVERMIHQAK